MKLSILNISNVQNVTCVIKPWLFCRFSKFEIFNIEKFKFNVYSI